MEILKEYKNIVETTETLYSILIYDKKVIDVIKYFEELLNKAKNISNIQKKIK
jgi:hypothetical protein